MGDAKEWKPSSLVSLQFEPFEVGLHDELLLEPVGGKLLEREAFGLATSTGTGTVLVLVAAWLVEPLRSGVVELGALVALTWEQWHGLVRHHLEALPNYFLTHPHW